MALGTSATATVRLFRQWNSHFSKGSFFRVLGTGDHDDDCQISEDGNTVLWRGLVSNGLTTPNKTLTLAGALALFDEISTWGLFSADRTMRPGVSVALSATRHEEVFPKRGEAVEIEATIRRTGRTLGFANMVLRDGSSGKVLASGHHTKFLPMGHLPPGVPWDTLFHPTVYTSFTQAYKRWRIEQSAKNGGGLERGALPDSIDELLPLKFSSFESSGLVKCTTGIQSASFTPARHHCNTLGTLHGGLLSMLAECLAEQLFVMTEEAGPIQGIHATFLDAAKRGKPIEARVIPLSSHAAEMEVFTSADTASSPIFRAEVFR